MVKAPVMSINCLDENVATIFLGPSFLGMNLSVNDTSSFGPTSLYKERGDELL
jgi:hypothetical protein